MGELHLPNRVAFEKLSWSIRPIGSMESTDPEFGKYGLKAQSLIPETRAIDKEFVTFPRRVGSCVLLEYSGKYFAAFTRHQYSQLSNDLDLSQSINNLCIYVDYEGGTTNIPICDLLLPTHKTEDDLNDIAIAVVHPHFHSHKHQSYFFPVAEKRKLPMGTLGIAVGYRYDAPFDTTKYSLSLHDVTAFPGEIVAYSDNQRSMLGTFKYEHDGNPLDGMSGGGVFTSELGKDSLILSFAGLIVRGGNGWIYFLSNERIVGILDDYVKGKPVYGDI
ncbi:hypothetical protein PsWM33_01241 [Pseudovibrio sp. WM33]|nr:hypothetical protein PsWM33_01241 [Pseudovibrio sp. WM33]